MIIKCILIFLAVTGTDFFWAIYIKALSNEKFLKASIFSAMIMAAGGFTAIEYINNHWMLIPAVIGAFTGTYLGKYHKH
jgi:hypothetical protein